ncbi:11588_t:CDS:2, partial [Acaulospora morrowiae]
MLPPSSETYNSADELFQSVQTFANSQGYVLIKKRICKDHHGELKNMSLHCDRGGTYSSKAHYRQTSSHLIDCLFEIYASRCNGLWNLEVRNSNHNYERVREMTVLDSRPREIVSTLRQNDESTLVTNRDIYNAREQFRQQYLAGRTPIQVLVDKLQE